MSEIQIITAEQMEEFDRLMVENPDTLRKLQKIISTTLRKSRSQSSRDLGAQIPNNQRHAEKAVRMKNYKKRSGTLGGYVTILRTRRNGASAPRPIPPTRSGKEREWSPRTKELWGYQGRDAQFILWWLTHGTSDRMAGVGRRDRKTGRYGNVSTSAARGRYFAGTHNVGKIDPNKINPRLISIMERVVNGEMVQNIDKLWDELTKR